jgi:hypothetical protein
MAWKLLSSSYHRSYLEAHYFASDRYVLVREICVFIYYRIGSLEKWFSESLKLGKFTTEQVAYLFTCDPYKIFTVFTAAQTAYKNYIGINIVKKSQGSLPHKASYKQSFFMP